MEVMLCGYCESVLLNYYDLGNGKGLCECRHCGEYECKVNEGDEEE